MDTLIDQDVLYMNTSGNIYITELKHCKKTRLCSVQQSLVFCICTCSSWKAFSRSCWTKYCINWNVDPCSSYVIYRSPIIIETGTHHCCLGRGSMEWEIFPAFPCPAVGIKFQTFWCWVQHPIHWATCSNMHNDQLYAITRLTANFMCGLMSDLVNYKFRKVWSHMTPNVLAENRCQ